MKYLLKQNKEDKGILCDKVTIDGFDYYVSDENPSFEDENKYCFSKERGLEKVSKASVDFLHKSFCVKKSKKVIACNNPNIDISQVVDDVEDLDILKSKWYDNQEEDFTLLDKVIEEESKTAYTQTGSLTSIEIVKK